MFESLDGAIRSWLGGLADAVLLAADRLRAPARFVGRRGEDGAWELRRETAKGTQSMPAVARITDTDTGIAIDPPLALTQLKGGFVRMEIPDAWVFRRALDPVSVKTAPYLDGFVRHHIERVTPWRVADTYYDICTAPLADDPDKMSVELAVVARDLVLRAVGPVAASGPRRLLLEPAGDGTRPERSIAVPLPSGEGVRRARVEKAVGVLVGAIVLGIVAAVGVGSWYQSFLDDRLADLDRDIAGRRAFLTAAAARAGKSTTVVSRPQALKESEPTVVLLLDALSSILPDHAYLTDLHLENKRIRITGVSRDVAGLIPVIERSGTFTEVSFFAPTTRLASLSGDRFYIEMRIKPRPGAAAEAKAP